MTPKADNDNTEPEACDTPECQPLWLTHPSRWHWRHVRLKVPERNKVLHHTMHGAHATYLSAGTLAGHGIESIACGILLGGLIINYFLHFDSNPPG